MEAARCGHAEVLRLLMKWLYPDGMSIQSIGSKMSSIPSPPAKGVNPNSGEPVTALLPSWQETDANIDAALKNFAPQNTAKSNNATPRSAPTTPLPPYPAALATPATTTTTTATTKSTSTQMGASALPASNATFNDALSALPADAQQALQQMLTCDEAHAQWLAAFEESAKKLPPARREQLRQAVHRLTTAFAQNNTGGEVGDASIAKPGVRFGLFCKLLTFVCTSDGLFRQFNSRH